MTIKTPVHDVHELRSILWAKFAKLSDRYAGVQELARERPDDQSCCRVARDVYMKRQTLMEVLRLVDPDAFNDGPFPGV